MIRKDKILRISLATTISLIVTAYALWQPSLTIKNYGFNPVSCYTDPSGEFIIKFIITLEVKNNTLKPASIHTASLLPIDPENNTIISYPNQISEKNVPPLSSKSIIIDCFVRTKEIILRMDSSGTLEIKTYPMELIVMDKNGYQIEIEYSRIIFMPKLPLDDVKNKRVLVPGQFYGFSVNHYMQKDGAAATLRSLSIRKSTKTKVIKMH